MKFFEQPWFKWAVVSLSFVTLTSVAGGFFLKSYLKIRAGREAVEKAKRDKTEFDDRFREAMARLRQNLILEHYLAAYKNLELVPGVPREPEYLQEYLEVLYRIGRGLLANHFLQESERVFQDIRDIEGQVTKANDALGEIESKRRLDSARLRLEEAERIIKLNRFRDAEVELEKAESELFSVQALKFDDVSKEYETKHRLQAICKFEIHVQDADVAIKEADGWLQKRDFRRVQQTMERAANLIGRAAFLRPEEPRVLNLRKRLFDLDAQLTVLIPNSRPIRNAFTEEQRGRVANYFFAQSIDFDPREDSLHRIKIAIHYFREKNDKYYMVRYRVFTHDNRDFFNGFFIEGAKPEFDENKEQTIVFEQEMPPQLRGVAVKRIEVKIFDQNENVVSAFMRAFPPGT